jgi:hypothetical protein
MSIRAEVLEYLASVTTSAHRKVDIYTIGLDCEVVDALL